MFLRSGTNKKDKEEEEHHSEEVQHTKEEQRGQGDMEAQKLDDTMVGNEGELHSERQATNEEKDNNEDSTKSKIEKGEENNLIMKMLIEMKQNNEKMLNKLEKKIEEGQQDMVKEIKQGMEQMEKKLEDISRRQNTVEQKIEEQNKKIAKSENDMSKIERKVISNSKNINLLETRVEEIRQENLSIAEEENKKTRKEIDWKIEKVKKDFEIKEDIVKKLDEDIKIGFKLQEEIINKETDNTRRKIQEIASKLKEREEWRQEIENNNGIRVVNTYNGEPNTKFDGDINKTHPKIFIQILNNKIKGIINKEELKEAIRSHLTGHALLWYNSNIFEIDNYKEFETRFLNYFWGENSQSTIRERLYFGRFDYNRSNNMNYYALQLFTLARFLDPHMREEEIIMFIARHYKSEVAETIAIQNIKNFEQFSNYLLRIERGTSQYKNNYYNNNNNNNNNYNENYKPNMRNNNNNTYSYNNNNNYNSQFRNNNRYQNNQNQYNNTYKNNRFNNNNNNNRFNNYNPRNFNNTHYNNNQNYGRGNEENRREEDNRQRRVNYQHVDRRQRSLEREERREGVEERNGEMRRTASLDGRSFVNADPHF